MNAIIKVLKTLNKNIPAPLHPSTLKLQRVQLRRARKYMTCFSCGNEGENCSCGRKVIKWVFGLLGLAFLVLLVIAAYQGVKILSKAGSNVNTITITGYGEVEAKPDMAEITFSLRERNDTTDKSKNVNLQNKISSQMEKVSKALADLGIEKKDIKTNSFNVSERYGYTNCTGVREVCNYSPIIGYDISQSVSIKVRDTENSGKVIAALSLNNAADVNGPNFSIDNPEKLKTEARAKAIAEAKAKAKELSKQLGVDLDRIISYNENAGGEIYPVMYKSQTMNMGVSMDMAVAKEAVIDAGSQKVTSNVSIVFEIED